VDDGVFHLPLSPHTKKYLDQLNALQLPPKRMQPLEQVRKASLQRAKLHKTKTPVGSVTDRTINGPAADLLLRVYSPERPDALLSLIVFFHGGGWATNSLDTHDEFCRKLTASLDSVVISVDYHLAPEAPFPVGLEDCAAAIAWAAEHAPEWNADPKRLILSGDSSGGNFAAALALEFRGNPKAPFIAGQLLFYPVTAHYSAGMSSYKTFGEGYGLTGPDMAWFWDLYLSGKDAHNNPRAAPLKADNLADLPPALVITAECDPLVDEAHAYALRLQQAGVPTTYFCYEGAIHGFLIQPDLIVDTDRAIADARRWLDQLFPPSSNLATADLTAVNVAME
jgi:acetyl esterase